MAEDQKLIAEGGLGSQGSGPDSQTAQEYIAQQLQLEADAREALPYQFDTCTKPLGRLRQSLFSCLTCNPPSKTTYTPAGVCYSCSISCHGEHELVELFSKRDFECDCGTTRLPAPCTLRSSASGEKGVTNEPACEGNEYNHNYAGRFCGCGDEYDPAKEKGTMFQCLGLGHVKDGGCGEDWWHPECLLGLLRTTNEVVKVETGVTHGEIGPDDAVDASKVETPLPEGFPAEDDFDHLICYKCVENQPWLKAYAGTQGFLSPVHVRDPTGSGLTTAADGLSAVATHPEITTASIGTKRKLSDTGDETEEAAKRIRTDGTIHASLPAPSQKKMSLFLKNDFRDHFCRCSECFSRLAKFPQLLEEEETYEPPVSESEPEGENSVGSRSLLDRGEAALGTMDRVKAIEGVMAYNHLKDKVKAFLQPFADSGQAVGAEDVKAYFARLRGDGEAIKSAGDAAETSKDNRREQDGY